MMFCVRGGISVGGVQGHVMKIILGQHLPRGLESVPAAMSGSTCVQQLRNAACSCGQRSVRCAPGRDRQLLPPGEARC